MTRGGRTRGAARISSAAVVVAIAGAASCEPIEPRPLLDAPMNRCPCEKYDPGASTAARCSSRDRCEILTAGGRPEYPFWIVVHVPDSSIFAPGQSYVFFSDAQGNPAFTEPPVTPGVVTRCRPPLCLPLGGIVAATGAYSVTPEVSSEVGYPLPPPDKSIPVRVVYEPIGNAQQEAFPKLPLDVAFASSRIGKSAVEFSRALPEGRYRRVFYPQPPFDELFPPSVSESVSVASDIFVDAFLLKQLDDPTKRVASITRSDGLDGWRAWLVDRPSQRRISVIRTLSGTESEVVLHTTGEQRTPTGGLGDDVEAVVAPPADWTAVPRYVTPLFGGSGLLIKYDPIPPPVSVAGVVTQPTTAPDEPLFGYAARVSFESESIARTGAEPSTLLRYSTTVSTDDRGRFAVVLPPGTYAATIEPAEGTGYAKRREIVVVAGPTALTFQPPPRTILKGRAVLTDGRPLSGADVVAIPDTSPAPQPTLLAEPRPGRTETGDDGTFAFELDPGRYVLSVIPKEGTGFPRVVVRPNVPGSLTAQVAELPDIRVPAPTRLVFTLRDPSPTGNVIANAVVRVFATPAVPGGAAPEADPVEIGRSMTDAEGSVEILLAQEPR
ncbi:MAG: carboxypeptidase regulatory-like domain-containing protein [Labilithrix sp.]|nr:carboxypeptidase regulatory-like domain-containing protein [Labilithrix sp.]